MNGRDTGSHRESGSDSEPEVQTGRSAGSVTRLSDYQGTGSRDRAGARDEEQGVHSEIANSDLPCTGGQETTGGLLIMAREMFEFYCSGGCMGYTMFPIDISIDASIIMVCPNCKHEHYRKMRNGKITEDRHGITKDDQFVHRIEPTLAAFSKTQRMKEEKGFLGGLWDRVGNK